jgi:ribonuclease Z
MQDPSRPARLVYSGDCEPNTFTVENSQDVDVLIHEIFNTPDTYVKYQGWTEQMAKIVSWTVHTPQKLRVRCSHAPIRVWQSATTR